MSVTVLQRTDFFCIAKCLLAVPFVVLRQIPMHQVRQRRMQPSTQLTNLFRRWNSKAHAGAFKRFMTVGLAHFVTHFVLTDQFFSIHI